MAKNKRKRDPRYTKSRAVKNSAKNAAAAAVLKMQQLKEAMEREAGNKEPSIDTDTGHEAQVQEEEAVAVEEPVKEPVEEPFKEPVEEPVKEPVEGPGQKSVASQRPELDQDPQIEDEPSASEDDEQKAGTEEEEPVERPIIKKDLKIRLERLVLSPATLQRLTGKRKNHEDSSESGSSPPKRTRSKTQRPTRAGSSSETADPDGEVTRYYTGKKVGLTNATLRCRGPRVLTAHPFRLAKKKELRFGQAEHAKEGRCQKSRPT
jgi:hypothetical protein